MNKFNEPIDDEFEKVYLFFQQGKFILDESFKKAFFDFLDKYYPTENWKIHDKLFENFGVFWHIFDGRNIILKPFQNIDVVFDKILSLVHEWEENHQPHKIHKGTPYYFYGMISILKGDIDKGLLLMHQASNEDGNLNRQSTPSKSFISLDEENQNQFFRAKVVETVSFLDRYISNYATNNSSTFSIDNLRTKFLTKNEFKEESFFFVYCVYKLEKIIDKINSKIKENKLASYIETTIIFELCKLSEILLSNKFTTGKFVNKLNNLLQDARLHLNLRQNHLIILNDERDTNFDTTILNLVNHSFVHPNFVSSHSGIEYDIALTYCLRNYGGHKIEDQITLRENFEKIVQSVFNTIFFIIEKRY